MVSQNPIPTYFNPEYGPEYKGVSFEDIANAYNNGQQFSNQIQEQQQKGILSRLLAQNTGQDGKVDLNKALETVQANSNQANQPALVNTLSGLIQQQEVTRLKAQQDAIKFNADINKTNAETHEKSFGTLQNQLNGINQIWQMSSKSGNANDVLLGLDSAKTIGAITPEQYEIQVAALKNMQPSDVMRYASGLALAGNKDQAKFLFETPDNLRDNETIRANNEATVGATLSGQQVQKEIAAANRAQELTIAQAKIKAEQEGGSVQVFGGNAYFIDKQGNATAISRDTTGNLINARKSGVGALPTPVLKLVTEAQGKVGEADLAITKLDKLLGNVDVAKLGPLNNIQSNLRNLSGYSNAQSQAYERVVSGLKDAANAILMAAKGVQTDGDAQRAERIVMASKSNDPQVVKNAINDLKEFSQEIKLRYQNQIGGVYANYGLDPNEYFNGQVNNTASPAKTQQQRKASNNSYAKYFD